MLQEILLISVIIFKNLEALGGNCSIDAALTYVYHNGVYFFKDDKYGPWDIYTNKLRFVTGMFAFLLFFIKNRVEIIKKDMAF